MLYRDLWAFLFDEYPAWTASGWYPLQSELAVPIAAVISALCAALISLVVSVLIADVTKEGSKQSMRGGEEGRGRPTAERQSKQIIVHRTCARRMHPYTFAHTPEGSLLLISPSLFLLSPLSFHFISFHWHCVSHHHGLFGSFQRPYLQTPLPTRQTLSTALQIHPSP